ncbi:MAG TPA: hypothetical protein VLT16_00175 [Candidatus Limnocylindrales bacterium]|nr:hypothetical protein [Candidatus Limnocylindrales bacterium]
MTRSESLTKQISALDRIISEFAALSGEITDGIEAQKVLQTKLMVSDLRYIRQKELDEIAAGQGDDSSATPEQVRDLEGILARLKGYARSDQATSTAIAFLMQIATAVGQLGQPTLGMGPQF